MKWSVLYFEALEINKNSNLGILCLFHRKGWNAYALSILHAEIDRLWRKSTYIFFLSLHVCPFNVGHVATKPQWPRMSISRWKLRSDGSKWALSITWGPIILKWWESRDAATNYLKGRLGVVDFEESHMSQQSYISGDISVGEVGPKLKCNSSKRWLFQFQILQWSEVKQQIAQSHLVWLSIECNTIQSVIEE